MGKNNPIIVMQPHICAIIWTGENYEEVVQFIQFNTPDMHAWVEKLASYTGPGHPPLVVHWIEGRMQKKIEIGERRYLAVFLGSVYSLTEAQLR